MLRAEIKQIHIEQYVNNPSTLTKGHVAHIINPIDFVFLNKDLHEYNHIFIFEKKSLAIFITQFVSKLVKTECSVVIQSSLAF